MKIGEKRLIRMYFHGHIGNIFKKDDELVHVSPTRSRELAAAFSRCGFDVTCGVYWPEGEQEISPTLRYRHIDKIKAEDYNVVFLHLTLAIKQLSELSQGIQITRGSQIYGMTPHQFQAILDHPRIYLQLDAPRPLNADAKIDIDLVRRIKCVGLATQNALPKWRKMYPKSDCAWVNAATIAHLYPQGETSPYPSHDKPNVIYLGRMNDASHVTPLEKLHYIANRLPEVDFHIVTNKIRDGKSDKVYAINELQTGSGREIRFHHATELIRLPNIFLHRGSRYSDSFDWLHYADCAVGFTVRRDQDVASCKSWEYFGTGVPAVIEEDTPETWVIDQIPSAGEIAKFADWDNFEKKIRAILANPKKYKRRKTRKYIAENHSYGNRAQQWEEIMEKY